MHKDIKEILYTEEEIKAKCDELAKQIDQRLCWSRNFISWFIKRFSSIYGRTC